MSSIRNVMVAGASDKSIGSAVVNALLSAGFAVSVLSRSASTSAVPFSRKVTLVKTDYTSSSLQSALRGQDAVVSCVGHAAVMSQIAVIDAAVAVGVQRFIPSEFGNDTSKEELLEDLRKFFSGKGKVLQHLQEVAEKNENFSWTGLATGPFIDWILQRGGLGFDRNNHTAKIYDSGNEPFTGTLLAEIGQSVACILQNPAETGNKYLCIRSIRTTQNAILAAFEAHTHQKWTVTHVKCTDVLEKAKQGDRSTFVDLLAVQFMQDGCGRGTVAQGEEDGEEGMKLLRPRIVDEDELIKDVISRTAE